MNELTVDRPEAAKAEQAQRGLIAGEPERPREERPPDLRTLPMAALAAAALAACGDGSDGTVASDDGATMLGLQRRIRGGYPSARTDAEAGRFLLQVQAFSTTADIAAVRASTFANWLNLQYGKPLGPTGWDWLNARGYATIDSTTRYFDNTYPGDYMIWNQLMTAPDPLRKRCALALSEFFVVSLSGLDFAWRSHGIAAWWDLLVANAFGNFRQLLEAVTLNAAMGYYLNTKGNLKEDPAKGRVPDENYAREVMQLFSIGLYQLNLDGTEKRDTQGNRIESYTQADVTNLARVFTGYDLECRPPLHAGRHVPGRDGLGQHARRRCAENRAGHAVQPSQRRAVLLQADDPAPGHQQPEPRLRRPRGGGVQQQRLGGAW